MTERWLHRIGAIACVLAGCRGDSKCAPWPELPLAFVEQLPHVYMGERIGHIEPIAAAEILVVPYYSRFTGGIQEYDRIVARPFLYRPTTILTVPTYNGYAFQGAIAVCPGYLASDIPRSFWHADVVRDTRCQLVELVKVTDVRIARKVLTDFRALFALRRFAVGPRRDLKSIAEADELVYSSSCGFKWHLEGIDGGEGYDDESWLWPYNAQTAISIDISNSERAMVEAFLERVLATIR